MKKTIISFFFTALAFSVSAKVYYLSPSGDDKNDGLTLETAWVTPGFAFQNLIGGDTLWIKGGTYIVNATVKTKNAGTKSTPICAFAIKGEKPVFDCSSMRNYGTESSTFRGLDLRKAWWHVRGIKIYQAGHNGIIVAGENIIVEGCTIQECGHDGISIGAGSVDALILNCDSYLNVEIKGKGENGDGFAAKEGIGTVFRGCRAWDNADDGWDVYGGNQPVLIDSCWSFSNGKNHWPELISSFQGDGNGFKLGGGGGLDGNAPNVVLHSFAFDNVNKGFDQNHNAWGVTVINSTGYNNNGMGNFAFHETPSSGKHVIINNLSYAGTGQNIAQGSTETTNSWNLGLTLSDDMFESLNTADAVLDRDDDYRLTNPAIMVLFKLKSNNPAIDQGTVQTFIRLKPYYAIPYSGEKPDLGAIEFDKGNWTFPTPDETEPEQPENPDNDRPEGTKTIIVDEPNQFTVKAGGGTSVSWGAFSLASAESAVFDMQAVGSSNGAVVIEFSKDAVNWEQVGAQAKNGSTSWVPGKLIDLSDATAPWGPTIYIRFYNNTNRDVNIKNLKITGTLYIPTSVSTINSENEKIRQIRHYNLNGQEISPDSKGWVIKKVIFENKKSTVEKQFKTN